MAKIQMWPHNRGLRNSVSFDGRTYTGTPGSSLPVEGFDVPTMEANLWTRYATVAGKTTITMLPPVDARHNQITLNGRVYIAMPGTSIEVKEFDAPELQANGWRLASGSSVLPPQNLTLPVITGTPTEGQNLTVIPGTWTGNPTLTYQWMRGATAISGATGLTYLLVTADASFTITIVETATNDGGIASATSAATSVIVPLIPMNLTLPVIYGIGQVGQNLTVTPGTWVGSPTLTYQWMRGVTVIAGATGTSYSPVTADHAQTIFVQETATGIGGSVTVTNIIPDFGLWKSTLAGEPPTFLYSLPQHASNHASQSPAPTFTGAMQVGQTLTPDLYITFTTYNANAAQPTPPYFEGASYLNTQIDAYRMSDGAIVNLIPADGTNNSNPTWRPDGQSIIYAGTVSSKTACKEYFFADGSTSVVLSDATHGISDFSVSVNNDIIGSQSNTVIAGQNVSIVGVVTSTGFIQITNPTIITPSNPQGDFDPHISPDGTKICFSRAVTPGIFKTVICTIDPVTFANLGEITITPAGSAKAFDGVPRWSSDGLKLIFWHTDSADRATNGLWTMNWDGTGMTQLPMPAEFSYDTPNFFPQSGSSSSAQIVYATRNIGIFLAKPVNTALPTIAGTLTVGQTLTTTPGTWLSSPTLTRQWMRGGTAIASATGLTYVLVTTDVGFAITVVETATNDGGIVSATSSATSAIAPLTPILFSRLDMRQDFPLVA